MRKEAIADAVGKAGDYAGVVGREIYPVEIMDGGQNAVTQHVPMRSLFGGCAAPVAFGQTRSQGAGLFGGGGPATGSVPEPSEMLDLSPPDIQVTSSVSVQFQSVPEK